MHNYREIKIWQRARVLVKDVYLVTKQFPSEELYGLTSQTRKAAVSVMLNVAEGAGRGTNKDFNHFLDMTKGSLFEVESLMILACDLEYIPESKKEEILDKTSEIVKMLIAFQKNLI
ncbi:four helix bundle protein [Mangrovibacterium lignilyticum]|uniref:four helix bundle protein n=1 Tax=Mangrovibacterium lignilyticum TaxID=2668052 RepID=UPI0013D0B1EF|nr:four helix bundle protein [Mangrovibacterium lignilyticum]